MDSLFQNQTHENILTRMLSRTNNTVDRSEDSVVFDASSTCAIELAHLYIEALRVYRSSFMDKAIGEDLVALATDRGLTRRSATRALVLIQMHPSDIEIPLGSVFSAGASSFAVIKKSEIDPDKWIAECLTEGTEGNISSGYVSSSAHIIGLEWAKITSIVSPAVDEESLESLRYRGLQSFGFQPYSGNNIYYRRVVGDLPTVGAVRVKHVSAGYIDIYILDSALEVPTQENIELVQELVDPPPFGTGMGLATFGCHVTVKAPEVIEINIETSVKTPSTWSAEMRQNTLDQVLSDIVSIYNLSWGNNLASQGTILIEAIESNLFISGFEDVADTKINGLPQNFTIDALNIVKKGAINASEIG